jgi:prevent-host-death family protein
MKTATVRDLRNHYSLLLEWLAAGEEILITQRGKSIGRLIPEPVSGHRRVDWSASAAVRRDRSRERTLTAKESAQVIMEAGGKW